MRFDLHLRQGVRQRLDALAIEMASWEETTRIPEEESNKLREAIVPFGHKIACGAPFRLSGVDGSGDFPAVAYSDSFVYVSVAHGAVYETHPGSGLREIAYVEPVVDFAWIPEEEERRRAAWDRSFEVLAGRPTDEVIERSDYRILKALETGSPTTLEKLREELIRPHAADAGNIAIQLRSTAELGVALRLICSAAGPSYVLTDGTLSLPLVTRRDLSLFYEHVKRLCCVEARARGVALLAISKSHGLPSIGLVEELAREKRVDTGREAEHWFLRLPCRDIDGWTSSLCEGRRIPPPGAVTYLVRFHRTTPVMRLDIDREFWREQIKSETGEGTRANERRLFEDLDYASHDQRCYGYPYPIKAGHDRASLTEPERVTLRKQIVDAAVRAGLPRALFRDATLATGQQ